MQTKSDLVAGILQNLGTNRRLQKQIGALALEVSPQSFPQIPRKRGRRVTKNVAGFYGQDGQNGQVGQQAIETGGQIAAFYLPTSLQISRLKSKLNSTLRQPKRNNV